MSSDERNAGTSGVVLSFLLVPSRGRPRDPLSPPIGAGDARDPRREAAGDSRPQPPPREQALEKGREAAKTPRATWTGRGRLSRSGADRLAAAVEAGRQAYRDEKEKM